MKQCNIHDYLVKYVHDLKTLNNVKTKVVIDVYHLKILLGYSLGKFILL